MNKILAMLVTTIVVLSLVYVVPGFTQSVHIQQLQKPAYAQASSSQENTNNTTAASNATNTGNLLSLVHPDIDSSPIAAVIIIGENMPGNVIYMPNNVTIKVGEEILIVNNSTGSQSVTNGMGPDDPAAGTLFDTGPIPPRGFTEYVAANLSPGDYPFYSTNNTSTTGVLTIEPAT
jgi:hypothetical protein